MDAVMDTSDDFGIVYIIENAQQFWAELEDIAHVPWDSMLSVLDNALRRFVKFCSAYHEHYLQSPLQLEHAIDMVLDSDLFRFHSQRMCGILLDEAHETTDPHRQLILYNILLMHGRRKADFLRSHKTWLPLIPLLMDYILVDVDPEIDDTYVGLASGSSSGWAKGLVVPIEAKLRTLSVRLIYEVCRVQKLSLQDLKIFDDGFLDHLFDLVEATRNFQDEALNYSVVKLIVALNEQFMVACLQTGSKTQEPKSPPPTGEEHIDSRNRVLRILMRRLNSSQTFGESMIFMLNRASDQSGEDRVMQLLVLKMLYLLFTTKGAAEFFYTNDLCVLVDVFLRELVDLDEENESLRHTFLRVLHPLLTKTQLRSTPYKRPQIVRALESLVEHPDIRDIDPTMKRLVERCLSGDWCVQFRKTPAPPPSRADTASPASTISVARGPPPASGHTRRPSTTLGRQKSLRTSRSADNLKQAPGAQSKPTPHRLEHLRRPSNTANDSVSSLPSVTVATASEIGPPKRRERADSADLVEAGIAHTGASIAGVLAQANGAHKEGLGKAVEGMITYSFSGPPAIETAQQNPRAVEMVQPKPRAVSGPVVSAEVRAAVAQPASPAPSDGSESSVRPRRKAPPPPPGKPRRKPPAVPVRRGSGETRITVIASSRSPP